MIQHVPSDVAVGQLFLPPDTLKTQKYNDAIATWTTNNKMILNEDKCNYMVFSRAFGTFSTRITINGAKLDRENTINHLGVTISEDLNWNQHVTQIGKKAYPGV